MTHLSDHQHLPATHEPTAHEFYFYGTGFEYFKIWIVNLILTVITLGVYSPWAKVRRLRYFYGNTEVNDAVFDFTANPKRILVGRLIALGLYLLISVTAQFSPDLAFVGGLVIFAIVPWLMRSTMRFMARNSQYHNVRFGFDGSLLHAYLVMILSLALSAMSLGLLAPIGWWFFKRYQFDNTYFGHLRFSFNASIWDMYKAMIIPILVVIGAGIGAFTLLGLGTAMDNGATGGVVIVAIMGFYSLMVLVLPLMQAYIHKATWQTMTLGDNEFMLDGFSPLKFAFIQATNYLGIVLTLGLFYPWAQVRMHRYKIETLTLIAYDDFDDLATPMMDDESALAEEIGDVFDFDISW